MKQTKHKVLATICIALVLTVVIQCKKTEIGNPAENEIFLLYKLFNPSSLTIKKGTTVKFSNKDNANHSATSSGGLFDSGKIESDESYSYTFNTAGTYNIFCKYHQSNMQEQGYIVVQ